MSEPLCPSADCCVRWAAEVLTQGARAAKIASSKVSGPKELYD